VIRAALNAVCLCLCVLAANPEPAQAWRGGTPTPQFSVVKVGAGGQITGISIASNGAKVIGTDVGGGYTFDASASSASCSTQVTVNGGWRQLITSVTMPAGYVSVPNATADGWLGGVWDVEVAASQTSSFYMIAANGYTFKSLNSGCSFTVTNFPQLTTGIYNPNTGLKFVRQKLAIDPNNQDIVYESVPGGIEQTFNSGALATLNATIPSPASPTTQVSGGLAFDPTGGTCMVSGQMRTCNVYLTSYGNGVWEATDGTTFSQIAQSGTGPTTVIRARMAPDGAYWCVDASGAIWKWASGTWTTPYASGAVVVAPDPNNIGDVVELDGSGGLSVRKSVNNGSTFASFWSYAGGGVTRPSTTTDIPWLLGADTGFFSIGDAQYDPSSGILYIAEGVGVWEIPLVSGATVQVSPISTGIEELVSNDIVAPQGGYPVAAFWDRPAFTLTTSGYPSSYGPSNGAFGDGWAVAVAANDPTFSVIREYSILAASSGADGSAFSTNKGVGFTAYATYPSSSTYGGAVAAATDLNQIMIPGQGTQTIYCTKNQGASWSASNAPSAAWIMNYYLTNHPIDSDKVTIGTYYAALQTGTSGTSGVYSSPDGCTWTEVFSGSIAPDGGFNQRLRAMPGHAGYLAWTVGNVSGGNPAATYLSVSINGGEVWSTVSTANGYLHNAEEVFDFGFGAPAPGTNNPSLCLAGWVDGTWALERIDNFNPASPGGETWYNLGQFANMNPDQIKVVNGDMNTYGTCYFGFSGSGFAKSSLNFLLKRDLYPAANDSFPMFLDEAA
jgi:hypothetical protein